MRTSQLARGRSIRAVVRLGLIGGAVSVAMIAGAQIASAATSGALNGAGEGSAQVDDIPTGEPTNPVPEPTATVDPEPTQTVEPTATVVPEPTATTVAPTKPTEVPGGGGGIPGPNPTTTAPGAGGGKGAVDNRNNSGGGGTVNNNAGGGGGAQLAVTGTDVAGIAGVGAAIAAGGVGLVLISRRRRETPAED